VHIVLTYQFTQAEIVRSLKRARRGPRTLLGIFTGLILLVAVAEFSLGKFVVGGSFTGIAVTYAFLLVFGQRLSVRRQLSHQTRVTTVTLTDQAIAFENDLSRGEVKWPVFVKTQETREFFLLFQSNRLVRVLPKRAFAPEQAAEFSTFLADRPTL
jgi:hypothetical protein